LRNIWNEFFNDGCGTEYEMSFNMAIQDVTGYHDAYALIRSIPTIFCSTRKALGRRLRIALACRYGGCPPQETYNGIGECWSLGSYQEGGGFQRKMNI